MVYSSRISGLRVPTHGGAADGGRRQQRRQETIEEILQLAVDVMESDGVAALSLSEVARRMGIKPPSLYKYFPSRLAVYDELFRRGSEMILAVFEQAARDAEAGLPALLTGLQATGRYLMDNQVIAALLQWRPVPGFEPSAEASEPNVRFTAEVRRVVGEAVDLGQLHPDALTERAGLLFSILNAGVISQQLANEPTATYDEGRFTSLETDVFAMFVRAFTPDKTRTRAGTPDHDRRGRPARPRDLQADHSRGR